MDRNQADNLLAQLLLDELDEPTRQQLLAYLETDAALRDKLADMRLTTQLLRSAHAAEDRPVLSEARRRKLLAATAPKASRRAPWWRQMRSLNANSYLRAAAIVVFMVSVTGLLLAVLLPSLGKSREMAEGVAMQDRELEGAREAPESADETSDWDNDTKPDEVTSMPRASSIAPQQATQAPPTPPTDPIVDYYQRQQNQSGRLNQDRLAGDGGGEMKSWFKYENGALDGLGSDLVAGRKFYKNDNTDYGRGRETQAPSKTYDDPTQAPRFEEASRFDLDKIASDADDAEGDGRRGGRGVGSQSIFADPAAVPEPAQPAGGQRQAGQGRARSDVVAESDVVADWEDEASAKRLPKLAGLSVQQNQLEEAREVARHADSEEREGRATSGLGKERAQQQAEDFVEEQTDILVYPPEWVDRIQRRYEAGEVTLTELPESSTFRNFPVNPWTLTERDALSTFAVDTDNASYALSRRYIAAGVRPPAGAVRMEEFINAFDYNYAAQDRQTFTIHADAIPAPFGRAGTNTVLLKVGVKGKVIGRDGRKPAHLVAVVDASGSMAKPRRLPLVKHSLKQLLANLRAGDRFSLITYGTEARLHIEAADAANPQPIAKAIDAIEPGGSTNLLRGVELAYQIARRHFRAGQINRVILCSDGVANVGQTDAQSILDRVREYRRQGIAITTAGFGIGGLNDALMEELANKGDGNYLFIDSEKEARRAFAQEMTATLQMIAKDAKIQVAFDPARVRRYRLIGYENRDIADRDFRNDRVDAGEVGSGQSATALYELELHGRARAIDAPPLGMVYVRYRDVDSGEVEEISRRLPNALVSRADPAEAPRLYLAACAAAFAEILRGSPHAADIDYEQLQRTIRQVAAALPLDKRVAELRDLIDAAKDQPVAP